MPVVDGRRDLVERDRFVGNLSTVEVQAERVRTGGESRRVVGGTTTG